MKKDLSIEYAHIYTNARISEEHTTSLRILSEVKKECEGEGRTSALMVLVDDYSFPDPSFDYTLFVGWLSATGHTPDLVLRESQLIPLCDETLRLAQDQKLVEQISDYTRSKKYPCSLFIATWYLLRLGYLKSPIFKPDLVADRLINILPVSFQPFEEKGLEIIRATSFAQASDQIDYRYLEGRLIA